MLPLKAVIKEMNIFNSWQMIKIWFLAVHVAVWTQVFWKKKSLKNKKSVDVKIVIWLTCKMIAESTDTPTYTPWRYCICMFLCIMSLHSFLLKSTWTYKWFHTSMVVINPWIIDFRFLVRRKTRHNISIFNYLSNDQLWRVVHNSTWFYLNILVLFVPPKRSSSFMGIYYAVFLW